MKTIINFLFNGAIVIAIVLYAVWHYYAPVRAEKEAAREAEHNQYLAATRICSDALNASVLEKTKGTTPGFIALETTTLRTTRIGDGDVVQAAAYVRTLNDPRPAPNTRPALSFDKQPLYILSCYVVNGQILKYEWIK